MIQTDILLILIFAVSILLCILVGLLLIGYYRAEVTIVRAGIFGIVGYFMAYIVISAFFFVFDYFSVFKCTLATLAAVLIALVAVGIKTKFKSFKKIKFDKKEFIFFALVILVVLLLSGKKFGYYGMGQDQGVYQTKAIELIYGNNSNVYNFDYALKALSDPDDYNYFRDKVKELQGYYLVGQTDPFYADETMGGESGLEGVYHGLPTWPAILALFGRMFGIGHMQECQTIFFICFLMLAFYILENFRVKVLCEAAALTILGTTPLMVWISKSALTEMFLAVIVASFVYLVCNENRDVRLYMWIPVAVFSVYHVSIYTVMPLFVVCCWMNIISDKRKRAVVSTVLTVVSFMIGFIISVRLAMLYTTYNYLNPICKLLGIEQININAKELTIIVCATALTCIILSLLVLPIANAKAVSKLIEKIKENKGIIIKVLSFAVTAFAILAYAKNNKGPILNPNMNLVAMSFASGIISIPLMFAGIICIRKEKIKGFPFIILYMLFMYMMVWTVFLRPNVTYFYYYGRYDVPYVLLMVIFLAVLYREFEKTDWIPVLCLSSVIIYLNYDFVMNKTPDDTKIEWDVVEKELKANRLPNSAVILEEERETLIEWMLILKASGVEVFPQESDLDAQTEKLLNYYDNIYYLYEDEGEFDLADYTTEDYEPLYTYSFVHSEDLTNETQNWIGYPEYFYNANNYTYMYLYSENN